MNGKARSVGLLALATAFFVLAFAAPAAFGDTADVMEPQHEPPTARDGFQGGTCNVEPPWPDQCSPDDPPERFFTQAGGHPPFAFTQYHVRSQVIVENTFEKNLAVPKTIRVDLPPGLTVNPQATEQCTIAQFKADACPAGSRVGTEEVTVSWKTANPPFPENFVVAPTENPLLNTKVPLWNLVPEFGEPARFGFKIGSAKAEVYLEGDVAWESDYHAGFTIKLPPPNPLAETIKSRLVNEGRKGDGTYITLPTTCYEAQEGPFERLYSAWLRADSVEMPDPEFPNNSTPLEADLPPTAEPTGCELVPFEPGIKADPGTATVDSPAPATVDVTMPFDPAKEGGEGISQSHIKSARVTMPDGMGINPSGANGLEACTDAQFRKGQRISSNACPAASDIGTVEVETPPLPPGSLKGDVYIGEQKSSDPSSGEQFRILAEAKSERYDIVARLVGNVIADPNTGQLTAVFDEQQVGPFAGALPRGLPQVPVELVRVKFDGSKDVLTSPPTCGPNNMTSAMEPWARPGTFATPSSSFTLSSAPGGGSCPATLAARPFDPGYTAGPTQTKAGAFTPFELHLTRPDGAQEFRQIDVKLPPGMVAQLRNLDYCPEENIVKARNEPGRTSVVPPPPCPDKSFVGTAKVAAGSGPNPYVADGNVYLAGPYKGAPVSLVFITPAVAGPFDLGNVVVRVALNVDPETVEVTAVSDAIPFVFGGVKLGIRRIDVSIYRKPFTLNPTNCKASQVAADIAGGGANPLDAAAWSHVQKADKFRATKCGALKFKPRFRARIFGGKKQMQRASNPKFRAILWGHYGDANIRRASFILPRATILDQSHIRTICTRVQLAADDCPKGSIYGYARARTPLLSDVVKGPVYLTSSNNQLPDLLADLKGQVDVRLRGVISAVNGRLKTVFRNVPDVPVRKFVLVMRGGNRGLLVNSTNLCQTKDRFAKLNLKAQNGKRMVRNRLRLRIAACR